MCRQVAIGLLGRHERHVRGLSQIGSRVGAGIMEEESRSAVPCMGVSMDWPKGKCC
jgi:hypothetical protein